MAFCINCGEKITDGAKFCPECGESQEGTTHLNQRKTVYEGDIHKCPSCGEVLDSFEVNCPACGHEFRNTTSSTSVREFAAKLEEIEKTRPNRSFGLKKLLANQNDVSETDLSKISLIRSFVIPNTKEDMLEFLVLASSNINMHRYNDFDPITESEKAVSDAWQAKFEQAYEKAKISFGNTPEFQKIQAIYEKKSNEVEKSKKKRAYLWIGLVGGIILMLVVLYGIIFIMAGSESRQITAENERLEAIVSEVYDALEADNYVLARAKAATLVFSGPDNDEAEIAAEKWNTTRNELLSIIDNAESSMNTSVSTEITDTTTSKADTTQTAVQTTTTTATTTSQITTAQTTTTATMQTSPVEDTTDNSSELNSVDIPEYFTNGYEMAEFEKYNSPASENGLGDSRVYFYCTFNEVETLEADGTTSILGYVTDDESNEWLIHLHFVPAVSETMFDKYIGQSIILRGVYSGYSSVKEMPCVVLDEMIILETGEIVTGMQKLLEN